MGLIIAKITTSFVETVPGGTKSGQFSQAEGFAGDNQTYQVFGPCNEDFSPPSNILALPRRTETGMVILYSYMNDLVAPKALPGERRLYSTNDSGNTVKAEVFLKSNGCVLIENNIGSFLLTPSGEFVINGATITTDGDFVTAAGISLNNHVHSGVSTGTSDTGAAK